MITIRKSDQRGQANHGWLDSRHTFSFANYYDPAHMGVSHLRVINEDRVAPGGGFAPHSHRDMEIISYVLSGALEHKDSMGNSAIIRPGEVQRMSAGSGVTHSEYNASRAEPVHFLQIWIMPNQTGIAPGYEQTFYGDDEKRGRLRLVASNDGRDGSVTVHQDAALYATLLNNGETVNHTFAPGRVGYLQLTRGSLLVNGERLEAGDGATITAEGETKTAVTLTGVTADQPAEALLFDLIAH